MRRKSGLSNVRTFFKEAVHARIDAVDPVGIPQDQAPNMAEALRQLGPAEVTREELLQRLKAFRYPYPDGTKKGKTFFEHADKLGLVDFLVTPPFLNVVRLIWSLQLLYPLEHDQYAKKISEYGYPLAFHRDLMLDIANDLEAISGIAARHKVPLEWLSKCRTELLRELRRQVSVLYSGAGLLGLYKIRDRAEPYLHGSGNQKMVLEELRRELKRRHIRGKQLAYQLTAMICSEGDCIKTGVLSPSPEAVRTNLRPRVPKGQP